MSYVDAGYAIALVVLFAYALSLIARRRRLARAAGLAEVAPPADARPAAMGAHGLDPSLAAPGAAQRADRPGSP